MAEYAFVCKCLQINKYSQYRKNEKSLFRVTVLQLQLSKFGFRPQK